VTALLALALLLGFAAADGDVVLAPDVRVRQLKPDVWLHVTTSADGIDSNGLVVKLGNEALLVDTPWNDAQTERLLDWAERSAAPVTSAVVTHSHRDRSGGIGALRRRAIPALSLDLTLERAKAENKPLPEPVVSVARPQHDDPRGFQVFYPGPGHTVDNIVVWFPAARVLHGGCLVKSIDATGMGYVGEADLRGWPAAIAALQKRYAAAEIVVPGHGALAGAAALQKTVELVRAYLARPAPPPPAKASRSIAITFDDLPFVDDAGELALAQDGTRRLLQALRERGAPAIGFVNEDKLLVRGETDARTQLLEDWLDAGMDLGNHNFGHVGFQKTPLAEYQEAVLKGEVVTRALLQRRGRAPRYYRHTFTQTGPTRESKHAFEEFLKAHGYAVAPFTVEHVDYVFATLYRDALVAKDEPQAKKVWDAYLAHLDTMLEFFEAEARELFGREIPQILLLHANRLNAAALPAMLERMRARGYRFVTLDEALRDEAYRSPDEYVGSAGPSWLHRFFVARGRDMTSSLRGEPDPPRFILDAYRARSR
jgi:glyoxylase-like metal-dependent hydrolase (beta-lactamase superfamily II)